jgi:hypothetical protein
MSSIVQPLNNRIKQSPVVESARPVAFIALQPATPTAQDMLGARAKLNFARSRHSTPLIAIATITEIYEHRNMTYYVVTSDNPRLSGRHMSDIEYGEALIEYVRSPMWNKQS